MLTERKKNTIHAEMKKAYDLISRAREITKTKKGGMNIAKMAKQAGVSDSTLRRLLHPDTKHQTLDMLGKVEVVVEKFEADFKNANTEKAER